MFTKIIPALLIIVTLASCSSMKPLNFSNSKQVDASSSEAKIAPAGGKKEVKFLDDISVEPASSDTRVTSNNKTSSGRQSSLVNNNYLNRSSSVEKASELQLKYAILLNTEVEQLQDNPLLEHIDGWYGTRYRDGGTTKSGIDCSAFVQAVYLSA
ncbi:MAG TPA: hypothetical protein VJU78_11775, partial [Chitinophagaceae bacterium]|nr:hypothetical protein [Chitinophagaceae bacterium]